jgi:NAD+ synthase (glutamine-hydrolysing)
MAQLRLALAQINPTVGDLGGNAAAIRGWTAQAAGRGAHLVAFPEMVLTGYPVEDLALRASFVDASEAALTQLAADLAADGLGHLPVVVGYLDHAGEGTAGSGPGRVLPQNCAGVLHEGRVKARYAKHHLPNYGVFDEYRIFPAQT